MTKKNGKKLPVGTFVFYGILLLVSAGVLLTVNYIRTQKLRPYLVNFENSQPKHKCEELYNELFCAKDGTPDWERLYELSGIEETPFESKTDFCDYMREQIAGKTLGYTETSGGLEGKKYIVRAGEDKIADFLLVSKNADGNTVWELGKVNLYFERGAKVVARTVDGHRLRLGGIPLDDSYLASSTETKAEEYLPEGVHGARSTLWLADGLLRAPKVDAVNDAGEVFPLVLNEESGIYEEAAPAMREITEEEKSRVLLCAETYARFMIGSAKTAELKTCFDENSEIYATVKKSDTWMQNYRGYEFAEETASDFRAYTSDLFSVRISFTLNVKRTNGTVKEFPLDSTFFFTRKDGVFYISNMTNVNVAEEITKTRLIFKNGGQELDRIFLESGQRSFPAPKIDVPEGQSFGGWAVSETDENGKPLLTVRFRPDENGTVYLPEGYVPEPLTLYAVFLSDNADADVPSDIPSSGAFPDAVSSGQTAPETLPQH